MHRIIKKKQKQKPITMVEPPPYEPVESISSRVHQRQSIMNELDLIKARVDQIIQSFENEGQSDVFSAASISIPVKVYALDTILKQHESTRVSKEKELSSARDFFKKCTNLAKCLEEAVMTTAEERANDQCISRIEDFETAFHNTTEKLQQIKSLNARMITKLSELLEHQKLRSQFVKVGDPELRLEEIINMYTNEAIKCTRLERTITNINDELQLLKSRNVYLTERNEADESRLREAEGSKKELEEVIKKLRTEVNILKHQKKSSIKTDYKSNFVDNYQSNSTDSAEVQERSEPTKSVTSPTPAASSNNTKNQQQEDKKNTSSKSSLQIKRQAATKYTSKLLDQQLNYMEELMLQGQQNVGVTEKQLSDLVHMTDEVLKQKYQEEYGCLCDSAQVVTLLLGSEGTEKLTAAIKCAAPDNFFKQHSAQTIKPYDLIKAMKTAVSQVIFELKVFIKLKRSVIVSTPKGSNTQKKVKEVQKWLDHELNGIDEEIIKAMEQYETNKKKAEKFHASYFDQLSKKIENNTQKLSKTLEKLNLQDYSSTRTMLENISTTVSELKQKPETKYVQHVHESPDLATVEERKVSIDTVAKSMQKISISTIDTIRKNVASQLKTVHNVTISSKSWRTKTYKKAKPPPPTKETRTSKRQLLLPALANWVEVGGGKTTVKSNSETTSLPTIQRPKTSKVTEKRSNHHKIFQNQKSVQILPTVTEAAELTGKSLLLPGKK